MKLNLKEKEMNREEYFQFVAWLKSLDKNIRLQNITWSGGKCKACATRGDVEIIDLIDLYNDEHSLCNMFDDPGELSLD